MAPAPHPNLLRSALISILPAGLMTGVVGAFLTYWFSLDAAYLHKSLAVFVAGAALVLVGLSRHHPFARFGAANQVTLTRGALVALLAGLIGERTAVGLPTFVTAPPRRSRCWTASMAGWPAATTWPVTSAPASIWKLMPCSSWCWRRWPGSTKGAERGCCCPDCCVMCSLVRLDAWPGCVVHCPPAGEEKSLPSSRSSPSSSPSRPFVPVTITPGVAALGLCALTLSFLVDVMWLLQNAARSRATVSPQ